MRNHIEVDREKSIYDQGLAVQIFASRTDRLNEWQMDEIADIADDLQQQLASANAENERLKGENAELKGDCLAWSVRCHAAENGHFED